MVVRVAEVRAEVATCPTDFHEQLETWRHPRRPCQFVFVARRIFVGVACYRLAAFVPRVDLRSLRF